jgi:hypothetical protein
VPLLARLAVSVSAVLLPPDVALLVRPIEPQTTLAGVGVLVVLHLLIAVISYQALTRMAPPERRAARPP